MHPESLNLAAKLILVLKLAKCPVLIQYFSYSDRPTPPVRPYLLRVLCRKPPRALFIFPAVPFSFCPGQNPHRVKLHNSPPIPVAESQRSARGSRRGRGERGHGRWRWLLVATGAGSGASGVAIARLTHSGVQISWLPSAANSDNGVLPRAPRALRRASGTTSNLSATTSNAPAPATNTATAPSNEFLAPHNKARGAALRWSANLGGGGGGKHDVPAAASERNEGGRGGTGQQCGTYTHANNTCAAGQHCSSADVHPAGMAAHDGRRPRTGQLRHRRHAHAPPLRPAWQRPGPEPLLAT